MEDEDLRGGDGKIQTVGAGDVGGNVDGSGNMQEGNQAEAEAE